VGIVIASQDEPGDPPLPQSVIDDVSNALSTATCTDGTTSLALLGAGLLGLAVARRGRTPV
jgi:hypothetical protein